MGQGAANQEDQNRHLAEPGPEAEVDGRITLAFVNEQYQWLTAKTSDIIRQLGFAAFGLIFLFRVRSGLEWKIEPALEIPAVLVAIGLALDLIHYWLASVIWGAYHLFQERKFNKKKWPKDRLFLVHRAVNWPGMVLWGAKGIVMIWAYLLILHFLWQRLIAS